MTARLFVTADNHLNRHVSRLPVVRLEDRRRRLRAAFRQVVDAAIGARAVALVLAGDTFDTVDPRNLERAAFARCLSRLRDAGVAVVATGGNHDSPRQTTDHGGYGPFAEFEEAGLLRYLGPPGDDGAVKHVVIERDGQAIAIAGVPWHPATDGDPLDGLAFPDATGTGGRPPDWRVMVTHAGIEGHAYPGPVEPVVRRETVAGLEVDLLVAGHVHHSLVAVVPCPSGRLCHVVVPGSTERMTFGESTVRPGYVVVDLPPHGPLSLARRAIAAQPRVTLEIPSTEVVPEALGGLRADAEGATASVVRRLEAAAEADAMATLRIHGPMPREVLDDLNLAEVQAAGARAYFSFDLDAASLVPVDAGVDAPDPGERRSALAEARATVEAFAVGASADERAILEDAWARIAPLLGGLEGEDASPGRADDAPARPDRADRSAPAGAAPAATPVDAPGSAK